MKKLLPVLFILFWHITGYCQSSQQHIVIQEAVGNDTITWVLRKDSTIHDLYIEKDLNKFWEYERNHPIELPVEIKEKLQYGYFEIKKEQHLISILLNCFSDDDLSKLLKKMTPKSRLVIRVLLKADGKVFGVTILRVYAPTPITKNEFLTSTEVLRFMNNVKKSSFPDLQGLPYMHATMPILGSQLGAELERRERAKCE